MKFVSAAFLVSLSIALFVCASAVEDGSVEAQDSKIPGFRAILTQNGLNYGSSVGLKVLEQKLNSIKIPDQTGKDSGFEWRINDLVISNFKIPAATVTTEANTGVKVSVSGVSLTIKTRWHAKTTWWPHISASGSATVSISSVNFVSVVQVKEGPGISVQALSASTSIGHMSIKFSGSPISGLLNLLKGLFEGKIKKEAEKGITNGIKGAINNNLNDELAKIPLKVKIDKIAELDYSLTGKIEFASQYLNIPLRGEFFNLPDHQPDPFAPGPLPSTPKTTDMLQAYVSEYVPNSASRAFWLAGKMNVHLQASQIPPESPIQFNTSSWGSLVPQLPRMYPNLLMSARIRPTSSPTTSFTTSGISVLGEGLVDMFVVFPNGTEELVFSVGVNVTASGIASVKSGRITAEISYLNSGVWLSESKIGQFDPSQLLALLKFFVMAVVVPYFNEYLSIGVPIPVVEKFTVIEPKLTNGDGYLYVSTNLRYDNMFQFADDHLPVMM